MGKIQKHGKWVPHSLSESAKTDRLNTCTELLKNRRKKVFFGELSWAMKNGSYMTTPKEKNIEWTQVKRPHPHQRPISMGKKVLLCVWWDHHGVLYHELLKTVQTVTADVYCSRLRKLSQILREKRQKYAHNQGLVLLLHDNVRRHVASVTKNTIHQLG
ncbi:hypothetical protein M514_12593 [Trichuris suis]|uniref:Transposase n=1 Tax=Trichuris suis TaxID=68888 RepID=A0A085LNJ6_9BILA|nr:hypothetical protein M513_12593 [Trichuris suis]KFD64073.1 hypothetical protein M514_12593 [Trichuris suis]